MAEKPIVFTRRASGMVRELGVFDVAIFVVAIIFGAGILMFAPQGAAQFPGSNIPLAYILVGIIVIPFIITIGYMLVALPRSGGLYVMIARVIHPTAAYFAGWCFFVAMGIITGLVCYVSVLVAEAGFARIGIQASGGAILAFSFAMVIIFWGINMLGMRVVKYITRVIVILPLAVLIGLAIYMLLLGPEGGIATYDSIYGAGAMESIRAAAANAGWEFPVFSWTATIGAFLAVMLAYGGVESVAALGGEMRTSFRTIFWGLLGSFFFIIALYALTSNAAFSAFGENVAAYTFLATTDPEALGAIVPVVGPTVPYFMLSVIKSNGLAFALALLIMLWPLNGALMVMTSTGRFIFAFSFDRAFPETFSRVNRRGVPTWAMFITMIVGFGGVLLFHFHVGPALGILNMLLFQLYWLFGLSAMMLPFVRPDIAERLPCGTKTIVGLGLYTFLLGWFFTGLAAMEMNVPMVFVFLAVLLIGFAFYLYQQVINKRKGIDISEIYRQIPPE